MRPAFDGIIRKCELSCRKSYPSVSVSLISTRRRNFSSTHKKLETLDSNANSNIKQSSVYSSMLRFYSYSLISTLSEKLSSTSGLTDKLGKEVDRYYKIVKLSASNAVDVTASAVRSKANALSQQGSDSVPENGGGKPPPTQIVLNGNQQQDLLKSFAIQTKRMETTEEKVEKLCQSIEKASSLLIKSRLIADLYQLLYDDQDACYIIYKKQKSILLHLINLKAIAEQKRDKILYGNVNQCLGLIGYVDTTQIKHRNVNILSIDGGGIISYI